MTKPKELPELQRPRRRLAAMLREILLCPLCASAKWRVIRWGERTTRFECRTCGLRWSLDLGQLAGVLQTRREDIEHAWGRRGWLDMTNALDAGARIDVARKVYPGGWQWVKREQPGG